MTHCCEATKSMLLNYYCTQQVIIGTFLENLPHTNQNIPSNLYWAKIWCILLEQQSQCTWINCTSSTELKSSFHLSGRSSGRRRGMTWWTRLLIYIWLGHSRVISLDSWSGSYLIHPTYSPNNSVQYQTVGEAYCILVS